jgi:ribonuclease E
MANKMLIDASHPEETRVVVVRGQRVEEFDFEAANRKQLRGNIYLAKVTRVEPSLQAAFVEYGGNRHGFLAFSEIHPDYYQIPTADRQALLEDEAERDRERERERDEEKRPNRRRVKLKSSEGDETVSGENEDAEENVDDNGDDNGDENGRDDNGDDADSVEQLGGDALEELPERRVSRRQYKIQEVIKRRQILLVQVVKEERGNKGAALTTYLSLAGRYSVLMPNTARGGGISRKITSAEDRKRLKSIVQDLEVPDGMGVILRTAGASRTKPEVKRDFEYLMRAWESVREMTLSSAAPALVYEEGSLIKRVIRDLYNKDIDEVLVSGDEGYREAKDFMRMLMPSHAKAVKSYKDPTPLFAAFGIEAQLDAMFSTQVSLKSGGYLVINPTEALVSIDVNSGRSTREHNIEDTALKTNLEAADEVARQLRLRDLAGLIVIDFIDMEENRNNRAVEKRLKEALKTDRARIQIGRISAFGLLEMSRQRMRTGVLESSSVVCPTCAGSGFVRATPSVALHVLRAVEELLIKGATHNLTIRTHYAVAFYILNQKRVHLRELEERFGVEITVSIDETLAHSSPYAIERGELAVGVPAKGPATGVVSEAVRLAEIEDENDPDIPDDEDEETTTEDRDQERSDDRSEERTEAANGDGTGRRKRRRRRRRGRGGEGREFSDQAGDGGEGTDSEGGYSDEQDEGTDADAEAGEMAATASSDERATEESGEASEREGSRRRRGRRGGRRDRRDTVPQGVSPEGETADGEALEGEISASQGDTVAIPISEDQGAPVEATSAETAPVEAEARVAVEAAPEEPAAEEPAPKPKRAPRRRRTKKEIEADAAAAEAAAAAAASAPEVEADAAVVAEAETTMTEALAQAPEAASGPSEAAEAAPAETTDGEVEETGRPSGPRPEPVTMVLTEPDPDRPKRAGWWSKAKQVITGS